MLNHHISENTMKEFISLLVESIYLQVSIAWEIIRPDFTRGDQEVLTPWIHEFIYIAQSLHRLKQSSLNWAFSNTSLCAASQRARFGFTLVIQYDSTSQSARALRTFAPTKRGPNVTWGLPRPIQRARKHLESVTVHSPRWQHFSFSHFICTQLFGLKSSKCAQESETKYFPFELY